MTAIDEKLLHLTADQLGLYPGSYGDGYRNSLAELLASLDGEAGLSRQGRRRVFMLLVDVLLKRSALSAIVGSFPEIRDIPIERPVFIVGLPRTGTTLLHNLLARDEAGRTFRLWELSQAIKPFDAEGRVELELISKTEMWLASFARIQPRLAAIHPLRADACDECNWLLQNTFAANIFCLHYYVPRYFRWLMEQDHREQYEYYKLQLQALIWRQAQSDGSPVEKQLVLKSPDHLWHLGTLLEVFPNARIVQLHRNIAECIPSYCSLCHAMQEKDSDTHSPDVVGQFCLEKLHVGVRRMLAVRKGFAGDNFYDVAYRDLVTDPIGTIGRIYGWLGRESTPEFRNSVEAWIGANRQHKLGKHVYSLEQFGLDSGTIVEKFSEYSETFREFL